MGGWLRNWRFGLGFVLVLSVVFLFNLKARADSSSPWLSPSPTLQKVSDLPAGTLPPYSIDGNRDCTNRTVITSLINIAAHTYTSCSVETAYGLVDNNARLQLNNTQTSGRILNIVGNPADVIPIPNSTTLITYTSAPTPGVFMFFTKNADKGLIPKINSNSELTYTLSHNYDFSLRDSSNNLMAAHTDSLSFSENGQWAVVDIPFHGLSRINLQAFEVYPFAPSFNYNVGFAPNAQTAITSDGRYIAIAAKDFSTFRIYDLSTCSTAINPSTSAHDCQSTNLWDFMTKQSNGFVTAARLRFTSEYNLQLYGTYAPAGGTRTTSLYNLSAAGNAPQQLEYLALGDSFASGEGAYQYRDGTDTTNNKCHLSQISYPYQMASKLAYNSFHSIACSGATITDVITLDPKYKGQVNDNIERNQRGANTILQAFSPGYLPQQDFLRKVSPSTITISAGGNDIGFVDIIKRCVGPDTCYATYEDRLELLQTINSKFDDLVGMYLQLKANSLPSTKIYVMGYPQIAKENGSCGANVHLDSTEISFANQLVSYLNGVILKATKKAGVAYVNTESSFAGHRLCETTYSNTAVNGLTLGNDYPATTSGPIANESYHPNAMGHRLFADTLAASSANFTQTMPVTDTTVTLTNPTDDLVILNVPHAGRQLNHSLTNNELSPDILRKDSPSQNLISVQGFNLKPSATYRAELHSDVISLGTFIADASGNISNTMALPSTTPTGFHTLHIYGTNLASEPIDIYKTVYVAASLTDYDGDGIPNETDPCVILEPSGQDYDKDGLDDSCDGDITEPPVITQVPDPEVTTTTSNEDKGSTSNSSSTDTPDTVQLQAQTLTNAVTSTPIITVLQTPASTISITIINNPHTNDPAVTIADTQFTPEVLAASTEQSAATTPTETSVTPTASQPNESQQKNTNTDTSNKFMVYVGVGFLVTICVLVGVKLLLIKKN